MPAGALRMLAGRKPSAGGVTIIDSIVTNSSGAVTTLDFDLADGANDDLLLALVTFDDNVAPGSDPTGWTRLYSIGSNTGSDREIAAYWRLIDGSEGATATIPTWTFSAETKVVCLAISGVSGSPISGSDTDTGSTTANPPGQNSSLTANAGDMIIWVLSVQSSAATMSAIPDGSTQEHSGSLGSEETTVASEILAGNPDTGLWTISSSTSGWMTGAVVVVAA